MRNVPKKPKPKPYRPEQTAIAVWRPTKLILDEIQRKLDVGSGVKALDRIVRDQAVRMDIPFRVNTEFDVAELAQ